MLRLSTDERKRPKQGKGGSQWTLALIDLIKTHRSVNRKLRVWERPATPQVYGKLTGKDGKSGKVGKWSGNGKGYGDQGHQGPENYENYENYGNYPMEGIPEYYGQGQGDQGQGGQDQYQDWWGGWYPNPWMQANCLKLREITADVLRYTDPWPSMAHPPWLRHHLRLLGDLVMDDEACSQGVTYDGGKRESTTRNDCWVFFSIRNWLSTAACRAMMGQPMSPTQNPGFPAGMDAGAFRTGTPTCCVYGM